MAFKFGSNNVITLQPSPLAWPKDLSSPTDPRSNYGIDRPFLSTVAQFDRVDVYGPLRFARIGIESSQAGVGQTYGIHIGGAVFPATQSGTWKRYAFASDAPTAAKVPVIYTSNLVPSYMGTGWSGVTHGLLHTGVAVDSGRAGLTTVARFPFAFSTTAGEGFNIGIANLTQGRYYQSAGGNGLQSKEFAIAVGGFSTSLAALASTIEALPFALGGEFYVAGGVVISNPRASASIANGPDVSYTMGGTTGSPAYPTAVATNIIVAYPHSNILNGSFTIATTLATARGSAAGFMNPTHGYIAGGASPTFATVTTTNNIEKFPFAASSPVATVLGSTPARVHSTSHSSTTSGYILGGHSLASLAPAPSAQVLSTLRLPFASDTAFVAHATLVGNDQSALSQGSCAV